MTKKRLLDCCASDVVNMDRETLLYAIRASEGRVLVSETIAITQPLLNNVSNAELAASQGADVVLIPAPGTVPGMSQEKVTSLIACAHAHGALAMTTIGTSQEGADVSTVRQIALMSKMAGADLHHIGDTGYMGIALPENIMAYSIAIRGVRHTYTRMARSINR
ncbi:MULTISPECIES: hypothetical protein [unclassified Rahnella]|uniref:DUF7916 family protein n=1 Tax=unclassified Rahnella TaxID=2635087 RepID=UPI00101FB537|nr:hypothetical protein [Rahnella sp. RFA10(1/100)]